MEPSAGSWTRIDGRDAVVHVPMIDDAPRRARFGTCRPSEFTLKPVSVSSPDSGNVGAQGYGGAHPYTRSNTRRSRKNGSSAWPAQVFEFPSGATMVRVESARASESGMEVPPTSDGAEYASSTSVETCVPLSRLI